ncbi:phenylacetaldehyde dehydrogenase [Rhodoblastus sphagnicola]|uniref:Salicylaldehyde dehydrogenase n=1 Tax=Rhodoblastus sphagnicola TaxID=333368 RepID=A0A2S6MX71_9HYPH|nr:aldehyde dehydrogenase family protein [Rhodoblastus sphagnicola]MBB4199279.1 aldehyde dehydrogenase (NAD+) [Rhodoblastus sphagnicola]PPQ26948.1 phenylacetaldehyde dehydrogenase [Rhodoblastus sphagnicola]
MHECKLFIGGDWVAARSGRIEDDFDPATGKVYARVHQAGPEDVEAALSAAQGAAAEWGASPPARREELLIKTADILAARVPEIAEVLRYEGGATFGKSMFESTFAITLLRSAAGEARRLFGETMPSDTPGVISMTIRRPLGVVAGITPFNFPFLLAMKKVCLALAAGNTFVLKPSEQTPVICLKIAEIFEAAGLPKGVLNVIPGGAEVGDILCRDPRVKLVTFTGSTSVGKRIAETCAKTLKRCTLELGGKSPMIVLKDADIGYAVDAAAFGIFLHQGQVCMVNSRLIVEAPLYQEFCQRLAAKVATLQVGDPHHPHTVIGPLISEKQCGFVQKHVDDAVAKGAKLLCGGKFEGAFYQPTILAGITDQMEVWREESFGPLVSVIKAEDSEDALRIANDTAYGLSSAVVTNDLQKAFDLSLRLEAGMVHVNDCTISDEPHVPFGGVKDSGFGREGGRWSMEDMTELKWITIQLGQRHFPF